MEKEYVLLTGVSSGIGFSTAKELIQSGFYVFGSVRKQREANILKAEFGKNFTPLVFDVTDSNSILAATEDVKNILGDKYLKAIINNAGIAVSGAWLELKLQEVITQFNVNFFGVFSVIQIFLPFLDNNKQAYSKIINISSVSGKISTPFVGPYAASKHALESLSDSLRRELMRNNINVVVIEPGSTDTPIWNKVPDIEQYKKSNYYSSMKKLFMQVQKSKKIKPDKIAKLITKVIKCKKPKARYAVPDRLISGWILPRLLPDKLLDKLFDKLLEISKG